MCVPNGLQPKRRHAAQIEKSWEPRKRAQRRNRISESVSDLVTDLLHSDLLLQVSRTTSSRSTFVCGPCPPVVKSARLRTSFARKLCVDILRGPLRGEGPRTFAVKFCAEVCGPPRIHSRERLPFRACGVPEKNGKKGRKKGKKKGRKKYRTQFFVAFLRIFTTQP